jgi:hypothetical protein
VPTIGYLGSGTPATHGHWAAAFVQRMRELGWIEGRTAESGATRTPIPAQGGQQSGDCGQQVMAA